MTKLPQDENKNTQPLSPFNEKEHENINPKPDQDLTKRNKKLDQYNIKPKPKQSVNSILCDLKIKMAMSKD